MSDINITTTNRNVLVTDPGIAVTIESNVIDVEVTGGRGPAGVAPTPSYLVYTALLTQTGTSAPVATVLENTLGGVPVWSYQGVGNYRATLSGVFTLNKTFSLVHIGRSSVYDYQTIKVWDNISVDYITLLVTETNGTTAANIRTYTSPVKIEIRVYP